MGSCGFDREELEGVLKLVMGTWHVGVGETLSGISLLRESVPSVADSVIPLTALEEISLFCKQGLSERKKS
jgi:hypothetical protein